MWPECRSKVGMAVKMSCKKGKEDVHTAPSVDLTGLYAQAAGAFVRGVEARTRHSRSAEQHASQKPKRCHISLLMRLTKVEKGLLEPSPYT